MTDYDVVQSFIKNVRELYDEPYVKIINVNKSVSFSYNKDDNQIKITSDFPNDTMVRSFATLIRDFFQDSEYSVRKVREIANRDLRMDDDINKEYLILEKWWSMFTSKEYNYTFKVNNNGRINMKKYTDIYSIYYDCLYAFFVHKLVEKRERLDNPFAEPSAKELFFLFIDNAFNYLWRLECLLSVAVSRRILTD